MTVDQLINALRNYPRDALVENASGIVVIKSDGPQGGKQVGVIVTKEAPTPPADYPQLERKARDASESHYKRACERNQHTEDQILHMLLAVFFELRHQTHLMQLED